MKRRDLALALSLADAQGSNAKARPSEPGKLRGRAVVSAFVGGVAERLIAPGFKPGGLAGLVGSNPTASARLARANHST
jgi:hypothetical protein